MVRQRRFSRDLLTDDAKRQQNNVDTYTYLQFCFGARTFKLNYFSIHFYIKGGGSILTINNGCFQTALSRAFPNIR